jgi:integrative and conjugative element protein (TIGR02256 family)
VLQPAVTLRLHILPEAAARIWALARASQDGLETGGILLGRGPSPRGLIDVTDAGDPGPDAVRRPDLFLRDLAHAQALADAAWQDSHVMWIGEWHTHPKTGAEPSSRDLATYAELLADAELEFEVFVAIIVTPGPGRGWADPMLTAWLVARTQLADVVVVGRLLQAESSGECP